MKKILKIWPLVILMMIAPVKDVESMSSPDGRNLDQPSFTVIQDQGSAATLMVNKNTTLKFQKHTNLSLNANLQLHSAVIGKGSLIIVGNKKLSIDANGNRISNLVISNTEGVELLSELKVSKELSVEKGYLYLNDFNLVLDHSFVRINKEGTGEIAYNGTGRIIGQAVQPLASHAPQNDRDYSTCAFVIFQVNQTPYLYGTQITYHNTQDGESTILCPPTPPPD